MSEANYDVAIVGYGPVGALTALILEHAGLRVAILERSREPVVLPRAVGLDGESVRYFQRIGLGDEVAALTQPPREGEAIGFTDSKRQPHFAIPAPPSVGHNGWRDIAFFDQPELEAQLREWVAAKPRIEVLLGHEVTSLTQDADGVDLEHRADGESATLRAPYVIGSDGASSFVRSALGIDWQSLGYDQDWLVVDITIGPEAELPFMTMQVCDPARLATYVCVKDPNRRWEFQLLPGETWEEMQRPEKIQALLDDWLPREHYTIRRAAVYQFHAATASRWNVGRVFLAGDAAHQTPPFLGQGLNAGFRDAMNLGWKLPRVLAGTHSRALLDSYAQERDAHARDLVDWAVAIGKLMETLAAREAGLPDPHEADMSSGYGQGRTAPPLRDGVLVADQIGGDSAVGNLLRQPQVRHGTEAECRLDALLGDGFAIVGRKPGDVELGDEASKAFERLGGRTVILDELEITEGVRDALFDRHPAAIVRPDRYVFGVVDEAWSLDALVLELGRKACLG
jgi:3-(3-hydroxy-phenyl)propionate hydroxylase